MAIARSVRDPSASLSAISGLCLQSASTWTINSVSTPWAPLYDLQTHFEQQVRECTVRNGQGLRNMTRSVSPALPKNLTRGDI